MKEKILLLAILFAIIASTGCALSYKNAITYIDDETNEGVPIPGNKLGSSYIDDEIDEKIIEEINELDELVVEAIVNNDLETLAQIADSSIEFQEEGAVQVIEGYSEIITENNYDYLSRYYLISNKVPQASRVVATAANEEYDIITEAIDGEIFISVISYKFEHLEYLLTIEYHRTGTEWTLSKTDLGMYSYNDKNAVFHYEKAKEFYDKGEYTISYLHIYTAYDLVMNPEVFRYRCIDEMEELLEKCMEKANETNPFPLEFDEVEGVSVYTVTPANAPGAMYPMFSYTTSYEIAQENDEELSKEVYNLHEQILKTLPEIKENFDGVFYIATLPTDEAGTAYREFIEID